MANPQTIYYTCSNCEFYPLGSAVNAFTALPNLLTARPVGITHGKYATMLP